MLITSSQYESANLARTDAAGKVFDYITTGGFCSRLETVLQCARKEQQILNQERNYWQRRWAEREQALREMMLGCSPWPASSPRRAPSWRLRCALSFPPRPAGPCCPHRRTAHAPILGICSGARLGPLPSGTCRYRACVCLRGGPECQSGRIPCRHG